MSHIAEPLPLTREGRPTTTAAYDEVRKATERLCAPLATEDFVIQSMPEASPTKWHLAHTTWFFETFVLEPGLAGYRPFRPEFRYLFNSYYLAVGERHARPNRGLLSRPTVDEVFQYRRHVDEHMRQLLAANEGNLPAEVRSAIEIGLHHEQQHQELLLTDIKHAFSVNPLFPAYHAAPRGAQGAAEPPRWIGFDEEIVEIGHAGPGFAYDNECPRHRALVPAFELASQLVTNRQYLDFIEDGGYRRGELGLSAGWDTVQQNLWHAPLYWQTEGERRQTFTLRGLADLELDAPVCHVSYFEADAFARWAGAVLPTEEQWERAARDLPIDGTFVESGRFEPQPATGQAGGLEQMFGDLWQWTRSAYLPYPGYEPPAGALGEYNGKFMCNQFVLRGGSCATPRSHLRPTYRNFFPPEARWQFSGIRLARHV